MRFLDELKEKRQDAIENVAGIDIDIEATKITLKSEQERRAFWTKRIAEIDIAIAALKAAGDHAYFAEKATAREQLEREPEQDWTNGGEDHLDAACAELLPDEKDDASEFAESHAKTAMDALVDDMVGGLELSPDAVGTQTYMDGDQLVIREITADEYFALAPENVTPEAPALNEAMQDEREEPVELPQPEWNEPQPTEGYAPVTNPAADEAAKAHDYYDPKAVHERQKFNPWGGVSNLFGKPKVDA